jgi:4-alpha-glucanotransferase
VIELDPSTCQDPERASTLEWWLANGLGGYAAGTLGGALTRRYHGLLIAPLHPPLGRWLLFAKADTVLLQDQTETPLHSNRWRGGVIDPQGQRHLASFRLDRTLPVWRFDVAGLQIEQRIWMDHQRNQTRVGFRWRGGDREAPPRVRLSLIASLRDHHAVNVLRGFTLPTEPLADGLRLRLPSDHHLDIRSQTGHFTADATWIEAFDLPIECERGLEDIDHHLRVGVVEIALQRDRWVGMSIGLDGLDDLDLAASLDAAQLRLDTLARSALPGIPAARVPPWIQQLALAADAYVFERRLPGRPGRQSVIAGYPWFGDWGRDTMIALPGLTLATGRPTIAREILQTFGDYVSAGMLPNVFPGDGETPEYNTVDAALWFIEAWRAYVAFSGDHDALRRMFPTLRTIITAYRNGTRFGIRMDPADGLIRAGVTAQQLTWMDARANGVEVTPRHGKPVEINALWYHSLRVMAWFADALGESPRDYMKLSARSSAGFQRFHRGGDAGLYDVLDGPGGDDATIRPNQIIAASLAHSPLSAELRRHVVDECREHLLTPYGLRSLAPADPRYRGRYAGSVAERDASYHQGPVWGWLLGQYALAEHSVTHDAALAQSWLEPMAQHLADAGLGQVSEIFDGAPPHQPRGAPAQAWSVACTLDAWWRLQQQRS